MNAITNLKMSRVESWGFARSGSMYWRKAPQGWTEVIRVEYPDVISLYRSGDFIAPADETFQIDWSLHLTKRDVFDAVMAEMLEDRRTTEYAKAISEYMESL